MMEVQTLALNLVCEDSGVEEDEASGTHDQEIDRLLQNVCV